jgi:hypothetical protein
VSLLRPTRSPKVERAVSPGYMLNFEGAGHVRHGSFLSCYGNVYLTSTLQIFLLRALRLIYTDFPRLLSLLLS